MQIPKEIIHYVQTCQQLGFATVVYDSVWVIHEYPFLVLGSAGLCISKREQLYEEYVYFGLQVTTNHGSLTTTPFWLGVILFHDNYRSYRYLEFWYCYQVNLNYMKKLTCIQNWPTYNLEYHCIMHVITLGGLLTWIH